MEKNNNDYSHDLFSKCFPVGLGLKQGVSNSPGKSQEVDAAGSAGHGPRPVTLWSFLFALDAAFRLQRAPPGVNPRGTLPLTGREWDHGVPTH